MLTKYHPDWIFNFLLKLAVVVCLSVLVLGLAVGVGPLTAIMRSGAAFSAFVLLAWGASVVWEVSEAEEAEDQTEDQAEETPEDDDPKTTEAEEQDSSDEADSKAEMEL